LDRQLRGSRYGIDHDARQRALTQLCPQKRQQELLFIGAGA
jgi:hypothetical protein